MSGNYSDTRIQYAKIILAGMENLLAYEGFRDFQLGNPAAGVTSKSGAKGSYEVVDDVETYVYRDASIVCLEGSACQRLLATYFNEANYGSGLSLTLIKNNAQSGNMMSDFIDFKIRCIKNPGVRTGMSVTGNGDDVAFVTYGLELQMISETINSKTY